MYVFVHHIPLDVYLIYFHVQLGYFHATLDKTDWIWVTLGVNSHQACLFYNLYNFLADLPARNK